MGKYITWIVTKLWHKLTKHGTNISWAYFNAQAPGRCVTDLGNMILALLMIQNSSMCTNYGSALRWMPDDRTNIKPILLQVMAWCRQATNHYLSSWWPIFMAPYGITRPQWAKASTTVETLYSTICYSKYFIELNFDKSTQYVVLWTHKRHPIPRPFGRAMECLLWVLQQKLTVL